MILIKPHLLLLAGVGWFGSRRKLLRFSILLLVSSWRIGYWKIRLNLIILLNLWKAVLKKVIIMSRNSVDKWLKWMSLHWFIHFVNFWKIISTLSLNKHYWPKPGRNHYRNYASMLMYGALVQFCLRIARAGLIKVYHNHSVQTVSKVQFVILL